MTEVEKLADLGETIHRALRIYCDSPATTGAWHLIYMMSRGSWMHYLQWIAGEMTRRKVTTLTGPELKDISLRWPARAVVIGSGANPHERIILRQFFRLFTDEEWTQLRSHLYYAIEEAEPAEQLWGVDRGQ